MAKETVWNLEYWSAVRPTPDMDIYLAKATKLFFVLIGLLSLVEMVYRFGFVFYAISDGLKQSDKKPS